MTDNENLNEIPGKGSKDQKKKSLVGLAFKSIIAILVLYAAFRFSGWSGTPQSAKAPAATYTTTKAQDTTETSSVQDMLVVDS